MLSAILDDGELAGKLKDARCGEHNPLYKNDLRLTIPPRSLFQIEEGSILKVTNVTLPKASFVKFRAQSVDFLDIQNPKVALEVTLRKFTCLTVGEIISLEISKKIYQLEVVELQPGDAASIIETDCITDFAEPLGYVEPKRIVPEAVSGGADGKGVAGGAVRVPQKAKVSSTDAEASVFKPFAGQAKRIDGKGDAVRVLEAKDASSSSSVAAAVESSAFGGPGRTVAGSSVNSASGSSNSVPQAKPHQSRIGDQFSKKKAAVSAFTGPGHKLG